MKARDLDFAVFMLSGIVIMLLSALSAFADFQEVLFK